MTVQNFSFGKNWRVFIDRHFDENRLEQAQKSLTSFLSVPDLKGKRFLDIGCGSGLFSLAAFRLGASEILSFDVDEDSVKCCNYLREKETGTSCWNIVKGSILDLPFLLSLGKWDIVYSWGVLHHTGSMWQAIDNASLLVEVNGLLYIAIYNKADVWGVYRDGRFGPSSFWELEKKIYCSLPGYIQRLIDSSVMIALLSLYCITFQNPINKIQEFRSLRGMAWHTDIKDWLGGYPYEYASVDDVIEFLLERDFRLLKVISNNGLLNNEYLFTKQ